MDFSESAREVYDRIKMVEPENVLKILGHLLCQDNGERDLIRMVFSPDNVIQSFVNKAKVELGLSRPLNSVPVMDVPLQYTLYAPAPARQMTSPVTIQTANAYAHVPAENQSRSLDILPQCFSNLPYDEYYLCNQMQLLNLEDQLECVNAVSSDFSSSYRAEPELGVRTSRRSPSLPEFPIKVCHYYNKGYCKHGNNCRYYHSKPVPESFSKIFGPSFIDVATDDHHVVSSGSLEKLEMELTELLKSRRGVPVSIAALPMIYYAKYGRTLQAEGYLTESQRHGKAGYSLTKLLARLKNSICLIDRPHGQHSVILAEDLPKYMEYAGEKTDPGGIVIGSHQIYLTFPAESSFSEQDVSNYFNKFGPVQDVRIPYQQKRMFGFVTFVYTETVEQILAKSNPHFVCGARVLVKPYREKSKLTDRKYSDKIQHTMLHGSHLIDRDYEFHSMLRVCDNSILLGKQLMKENEQTLEIERIHSGMQLASRSLINHPYFGYTTNDLKRSEEQSKFSTNKDFNYFMHVLNNGGSSSFDDKIGHIKTNYNDQNSSQGINLPDSPFASPLRSGISSVT